MPTDTAVKQQFVIPSQAAVQQQRWDFWAWLLFSRLARSGTDSNPYSFSVTSEEQRGAKEKPQPQNTMAHQFRQVYVQQMEMKARKKWLSWFQGNDME